MRKSLWLLRRELQFGTGDVGSVPGLGRSPAGRNGNLLQYPPLGNARDRGTWQAMIHKVAKNQTQMNESMSTDFQSSLSSRPMLLLPNNPVILDEVETEAQRGGRAAIRHRVAHGRHLMNHGWQVEWGGPGLGLFHAIICLGGQGLS